MLKFRLLPAGNLTSNANKVIDQYTLLRPRLRPILPKTYGQKNLRLGVLNWQFSRVQTICNFPWKFGGTKRKIAVNMTSKNVSMTAPVWSLESKQFKPKSLIIKMKKTKIVPSGQHITLTCLGAITVRKYAILVMIVQNKKTSFGLDDFLVDGWD